ncbi:type II and III secretion system protein family protein [Desulfobacula sp.]|uniref:type II and III secretion system protein family protein n=1 Tax=Desulfobacula sp. TaxID=2593537 RepID=UPI00260EFF32|nr:type II and III secretion system protein family protein [Desulfobacula sp.]
MTTLLRFNKITLIVLFFLIFIGVSSHAQNNLVPETVEPFKIDIISGKSIVMKSEVNVKRISIGSPEIADFILLSPKEIYLKGKVAGLTNMILWQNGNVTAIYDIEVKYDLSRLKEKLYQILPDEKEIRIMSTNDSLMLSGRISSAENLSQAITLAQSYAPAGKVINLLTVGGTHQVMLEVKIAEMSRSVGRNLGIDLESAFNIGNVAIQLLSNFGVDATTTGGPTLGIGGSDWDTMINALKSNGQVKILAEPNLITLSGQTASFLAGGEYAIPVSDEDGITIEYKDYGVGLSFTPNVLSQDKINIKVETSVSELLPTANVTNQNFVAPGLSTRRTSTTVELADGQSFAIAGLLSESITETVKKFPFLGDIPFLGVLFRSSSFLKNETELVIIVTPRLVKPINKETLPVPTDYYEEPSDTEFYFDMKRSSKESSEQGSADGSMDGQFGHSFED